MKKVSALLLTLLTLHSFSYALSSDELSAVWLGNESDSVMNKGSMEVRMTNSESSCFGLILNIVNIEVYNDKTGWVTLNNYDQRISSTSFMNGEESLLANSDLPSGTYSKLRLTFGNSNYLRSSVNNISPNDLRLKQQQVEIPIFQEVNSEMPSQVFIHFDLTTSVTVLPEMYVLNPVMEEIANPDSKPAPQDLTTISSTY